MAKKHPLPPVLILEKLDPVAVMFALGSPARWPVIRLLADGREMNMAAGAAAAGCSRMAFRKHLDVLVEAGVVECCAGTDHHDLIFYVPACRRPALGVVDYGFCRIDFRHM